jgi:hypothetical protein
LDGVADCLDACDDDPLKAVPGVCGCGVADVDGDNDGILDCQDGCPADPLKTAAGTCGCGVRDVDDDNDGFLDCQDGCPADPLKVTAGLCGCGVSDTADDRLGGTTANAAGSCVAILEAGHACGDTTYWIDTTGGNTSDAFLAFCDMTTDGGGWMKVESATYPFWFTDSTWASHNAGAPLSNNYSVLDKRQSLADVGGCYEFRLQVGNAGDWTSLQSHETIWRQCHDPFTASTNGSDYTYVSGEVSTTCGGFNDLHHKYIGSSYTSDPDLNDEINCWWMQIVPKVQYRTPAEFPGYLEGYGGAGNIHTWQSFWIRSAGLGKARGEPGLTCDALRQAGIDEDGTYWIDPNGGSNADAFLAYCDMTETVGWTRVQGARYPHFFTSANWSSLAIDTPAATNFSMLTRRALFASGGCTTWRVQVADAGTWQSPAEFETVWRQCHDPFTQTTNGSGYTFISGVAPTTCGGFNGLHHKTVTFMYTTDVDSTDEPGCWGMQMVPHTQYPNHSGYYDGYP